jgi:hypothetical protein
VPKQTDDRLQRLVTTFSTLQSHRQSLMNRIRGTLDEMRDLRNRLRQHYGSGPRGEKELLGSGKGITELYWLTPR